jgi:hypothetical protein
MSGLNNFFRPGEIIVERLAAALPSIRVSRAQDYTLAQESVNGSVPEILVRLLRGPFTGSAGGTTVMEQQYSAFYVVPGHSEDWERDGPVLTAMLRAMTGFEPEDEEFIGEFAPVGSLVPQSWDERGVIVYPVVFSVPVRL